MLGAVDLIEEELELRVKQFKDMDKLLRSSANSAANPL